MVNANVRVAKRRVIMLRDCFGPSIIVPEIGFSFVNVVGIWISASSVITSPFFLSSSVTKLVALHLASSPLQYTQFSSDRLISGALSGSRMLTIWLVHESRINIQSNPNFALSLSLYTPPLRPFINIDQPPSTKTPKSCLEKLCKI